AELRALADAKRLEKVTAAELATAVSAQAQHKEGRGTGPAVVVEELGSDEEDVYEGRVEEDEDDSKQMTENTPEVRTQMYREIAQQKKEKAERDRVNAPKERDYEQEHSKAVEEARRKEEEMGEREVRQKNEGGFAFSWDEEGKPGHIVLEVSLSRHMDSSLIDVDVHPSYVSVVVKGK
ncbi:lrrc6, partial [Symbiodinium microadriaticum]